VKAIVLHGCTRVALTIREPSVENPGALGRTIGFAAGAMALMTLVLLLPPFLRLPADARLHGFKTFSGLAGHARLLMYLIPQAVPLSLPVGVTLGIICGLGRREVSRRLAAAILALAVVCSVVSFVTLAFVLPVANQAFRESITESVVGHAVVKGPVVKGTNELTLGELREKRDAYVRAGRATDYAARHLAVNYHLRWALPCASCALALFALAVVSRGRAGGLMLAVAVSAALFAYYLLLFTGIQYGEHGDLPAVAAAWLPNAMFVAISGAMLNIARRSTLGDGSSTM
jgi:lipopolysaccharide export LptBFGC system permease protein LptF